MRRPVGQAGIIYDTFEVIWVIAYKYVIQNLDPKMTVCIIFAGRFFNRTIKYAKKETLMYCFTKRW